MDPVPPSTSETDTDWDVATSPRWLQPVGALVLGATILYFLAGFHMVFRDRPPRWTVMSYWSMFSVGSWTNSVLEAEGVWGKETRPIDLAELFPTRWESGYRFSRSSFKRNTGRLRVLGAAACHRMEDPPERIEFYVLRWRKTLGTMERTDVTRERKLDWPCSRGVRMPGGRFLEGVN